MTGMGRPPSSAKCGGSTLILSLGIVCLLAIAVAYMMCTDTGNPAGLMPPRTPVGTPIPAGHLVVTEEQNKATIPVKQGDMITV